MAPAFVVCFTVATCYVRALDEQQVHELGLAVLGRSRSISAVDSLRGLRWLAALAQWPAADQPLDARAGIRPETIVLQAGVKYNLWLEHYDELALYPATRAMRGCD